MVLYSYAAHLRQNTYHSLPLTADAHAARDAIVASRSQNATPIEEDELALAEADIERDRASQAAIANGGRRSPPTRTSPKTSSPQADSAALPTGAKAKRTSEDDFSWD